MKYMRFICSLLIFIVTSYEVIASTALSGAVIAMSAATSINNFTKDNDSFLGSFFSPKGGICLEKVMILVKNNMNNNGAVKLHIVITYDNELTRELSEISSDRYFARMQQLVKDYPNKLKILEWKICAKERLMPWIKVKYPTDHMTPLAGFVFVSYSTNGEHRARISASQTNMKIILEKDDFSISYESSDD